MAHEIYIYSQELKPGLCVIVFVAPKLKSVFYVVVHLCQLKTGTCLFLCLGPITTVKENISGSSDI